AAPVKLNHRALLRNTLAYVLNLTLQRIQVGNRDFLIFLNGNIAGTKEAEALAEGNVHVERKRRRLIFRASVETFEIVGPEIIFPDGSGGIARITRAGTIIFFKSGVGDLSDLELVRWLHS